MGINSRTYKNTKRKQKINQLAEEYNRAQQARDEAAMKIVKNHARIYQSVFAKSTGNMRTYQNEAIELLDAMSNEVRASYAANSEKVETASCFLGRNIKIKEITANGIYFTYSAFKFSKKPYTSHESEQRIGYIPACDYSLSDRDIAKQARRDIKNAKNSLAREKAAAAEKETQRAEKELRRAQRELKRAQESLNRRRETPAKKKANA